MQLVTPWATLAALLLSSVACATADSDPGAGGGGPIGAGGQAAAGSPAVGGQASGGAAAGGEAPTGGTGGAGGAPVDCSNPLDLAGCACPSVGEARPCYGADAATQHVGACKDGVQTCESAGEFATWGACTGAVVPTAEQCTDAVDLDCNGLVGCQDSACVPILGDACSCDSGALDQSSWAPVDLGNAINECCRYVAQTFTAGVSGTLTAVRLDVTASASSPLTVAIRATNGDSPLGPVLTSVVVASATPADLITLPPISVVAGVRYAIVVSYDSAPPPGAGMGQGTWAGATSNTYPDGEIFLSYLDGMTWDINYADFDLHFETYVCPN